MRGGLDLDAAVAVAVVVAHLCATAVVLMIVFVVVVVVAAAAAAAILDPGDDRRMQLSNMAPFAMLVLGVVGIWVVLLRTT